MDGLQTQLDVMNRKLDNLYQLVEQLTLQVNEALTPVPSPPSKPWPPPSVSQSVILSSLEEDKDALELFYGDSEEMSLNHKDILSDQENWERSSEYSYLDERNFSPDTQIRRLTAQVTAAYNRIAALEEQLLARRSGSEIHSDSPQWSQTNDHPSPPSPLLNNRVEINTDEYNLAPKTGNFPNQQGK